MIKYKLTAEGVQDQETGAFIPNNPLNRDWRNYQNWLKKKGNKPDPEFTAEELAVRKDRDTLALQQAIVDAKIRLDGAAAEGMDAAAAEYQAQLDSLMADLNNFVSKKETFSM